MSSRNLIACKQIFFITLFLFEASTLLGQTSAYSFNNAHSHNDYLQSRPFFLAYEHQFGSLEADIFYRNDSLFVAHEREEMSSDRTFDRLYLEPLVSLGATQNGAIYPQEGRYLQLLIDLKTPYDSTLEKLVEKLAPHKDLWYPKGSVKIVISGNTPPPDLFKKYPEYIFFDGRPENSYSADQLRHIGLISQSFTKYSGWKGEGFISEEERRQLKKIIDDAHHLGKPFRFWASPDTPLAWKMLIDLKADYINTDKIEELAAYLNQSQK